jgi:hypothetical protein
MKYLDLTLQSILWLAVFICLASGGYVFIFVLAFLMGCVQALSALIHLIWRDSQYLKRYWHGGLSLFYFLFAAIIAPYGKGSLFFQVIIFGMPPLLALFYTYITWKSLTTALRKPSKFLPHINL